MEDNSISREKSNNMSYILQNMNNSHEMELSKNFYEDNLNKNKFNKNIKEELSLSYEGYQGKITSIVKFINEKIDEMINKLQYFKNMSMKSISSEKLSNSNNNIINQKLINNETCEEIKKFQNSYDNTLNEISFQIEELDTKINSYFDYIKDKINKIKSYNDEPNEDKKEIININTFKINFCDNNDEINDYSSSFNKITKEIFIQSAESKFGLDNQFELVKYNKDNDLLIHINNHNDLLLRLINRNSNEVNNTLIFKSIFPDEIREIRYYSKEIINDEDENETKNFLLVSSQKNEIKIFEVLMVDKNNLENILKEINHLKNIYEKPSNYISQNFFDLSSCVIRLKTELDESEIYTTCWEGNSIKVFNLFLKECKTEIISKTSCNIKFCDLIEDNFLVFCGCNKQDNFTCANLIDLNNLDYTKEKNNEIIFVKYKDLSPENKENVHFNLFFYKKENKKYLITCDEKGYLRLFNFENQELIYKIFPSDFNEKFKYNENNFKIRRLNTIIYFKQNYFLITERNTGYVFLVEFNEDKDKKIEIKDCFNLFNNEIISIRKYHFNEFLVLGKDIAVNLENDLSPKEMIKKFSLNYNN